MSDTYNEMTRLLQRLHRRHMDVVRVQLAEFGNDDVTPPQAMMLTDIGDGETAVRDLIDRNYYLASTASYNIRKLVEAGYLDQTRAVNDRRLAKLKLTDRGRELRERLIEPNGAYKSIGEDPDDLNGKLTGAIEVLRLLERGWFEYINFKDL